MKHLTVIIVLIAAVFAGCKNKSDDPEPVTHQGVKYIHSTGITVLSLKGSYYEMGMHYGLSLIHI